MGKQFGVHKKEQKTNNLTNAYAHEPWQGLWKEIDEKGKTCILCNCNDMWMSCGYTRCIAQKMLRLLYNFAEVYNKNGKCVAPAANFLNTLVACKC